jgi:hypothetical protein
MHAGELVLIDTTTPMMRRDNADVLDVRTNLAPFPAVLRPALGRFVVPGVLARYHRQRDTLIDLVANFNRDRITQWIPAGIEAINQALDEPVTRAQSDAYYRADARLWTLVQWLKRVNRRWTQSVRHREYPVLLPGHIDR